MTKENKRLITKFKKTLLKHDGRTLIWFHRTYLKKLRYNYFIFQLNGHGEKDIDNDIINSINLYTTDFNNRQNG